jgi:phosphopantothenoylcysteine decarboxylase/phosphopantothenate--cysteine ligase
VQLRADDICILGPDSGMQACGEVGLGRMLEPEDLLTLMEGSFQPKLLQGKKVMVTAGATLEMIDPVRAITNLSSGKMGYAVAQAAQEMGAEVTLISGSSTCKPPLGVKVTQALSADAMYQSVMQQIALQDIFIAVAAVADYRPLHQHQEKIKKSKSLLTLELSPNKDILLEVASLPNAPFCVGFAAETENMLEYAETKRNAKKLPLIVANNARDAMGSDMNSVTLLDKNGAYPLERASKIEVARLLLQHVTSVL